MVSEGLLISDSGKSQKPAESKLWRLSWRGLDPPPLPGEKENLCCPRFQWVCFHWEKAAWKILLPLKRYSLVGKRNLSFGKDKLRDEPQPQTEPGSSRMGRDPRISAPRSTGIRTEISLPGQASDLYPSVEPGGCGSWNHLSSLCRDDVMYLTP